MAVQKSTVAWYSRSPPGCGPRGCCGCCAPENIPEKMSLKLPQLLPVCVCATGFGGETGKIEAAEVDRSAAAVGPSAALLTRVSFGLGRVDVVRVEPELVVDLALLFVAQDVVGLGDFLELLLGLLVVGIDVGVILPREFTEGLADLLRGGRLLHAEHRVIVFVGRRGHGSLLSSKAFR